MFTRHVTRKFSAYLHEELSPEENRRVAEHLIGCNRCRVEFERVRFGMRLAQQLPIMTAPQSVWPEIDAALRKQPVTQMIADRRWRPATRLAIAASIIVLLVGSLLIIRSIFSGAQPSWAVARLEGTPRIGSRAIVGEGNLRVGQWLETDAGSRAQIDVGTIGQVEVDPNTRVRLLETKPTEHRLELARGRMSARVWAPPRLFFVNTPSGIAEDLGCAYTLEVDDDGNSILHVTSGWVSLQLTNRESSVPAGAACATRRGIGPGTPYFEDASEGFRSALAKFDFSADKMSKDSALKIIIGEAHARDVMTLWYLLSRVDASERGPVYDRMAELVPPPETVTRAGILSLNQQMLERWKEKLAFASNPNSPKLNLKKI